MEKSTLKRIKPADKDWLAENATAFTVPARIAKVLAKHDKRHKREELLQLQREELQKLQREKQLKQEE